MILNALRWLRMDDFTLIDRMTLREYRLRMKAYELRHLDEEFNIHMLAWLSRDIEATKKKGKNGRQYVFTKWKDFFDYEKREAEILGKQVVDKKKTMMDRYAEYLRRKKNE